MKAAVCIFVLGTSCVLGACERPIGDAQPANASTTASVDDLLQEIAAESELSIFDISVPFERFAEAPQRLRRIADALSNETAGLFVLRYYDDTLKYTLHVFAISREKQTYLRLTSFPHEQATRVEYSINSAEYDEPKKTLILHTDDGTIYLTPTEITAVGA